MSMNRTAAGDVTVEFPPNWSWYYGKSGSCSRLYRSISSDYIERIRAIQKLYIPLICETSESDGIDVQRRGHYGECSCCSYEHPKSCSYPADVNV